VLRSLPREHVGDDGARTGIHEPMPRRASLRAGLSAGGRWRSRVRWRRRQGGKGHPLAVDDGGILQAERRWQLVLGGRSRGRHWCLQDWRGLMKCRLRLHRSGRRSAGGRLRHELRAQLHEASHAALPVLRCSVVGPHQPASRGK